MGNCITYQKKQIKTYTELKETTKKDEFETLNNCDCDTSLFCIKGKKTGKVVSVYDGDTFQIVFKFDGRFQKFKVRCYGYNSEEIRQPKNGFDREFKKAKAFQDKKALEDKILNKIVTIDCLKFGKYGRIIAKVYIDTLYVNKWMVDNGHGSVYMTESKYELRDPITSKEGELTEASFISRSEGELSPISETYDI